MGVSFETFPRRRQDVLLPGQKSIEENIFPDAARIASVIPLDKGKPNKNEISNYRPISVLNTFSKFYKKVIKKQLVRFMEEYLSPLISA